MKHTHFIKYSVISCLLIILAVGSLIPFFFESPSIFYKTGADKLMLRSGKILGIIASFLLLIQLLLISHFEVFKKIYGLKNLIRYHRLNGLLLLLFALIHPVLILGADHFVFFPLEMKYWPEFTGVLLLIVLLIFVVISYWQKKIGIPYKLWRLIHKSGAPILFIGLSVHVFNVSRSFESGIPFYGLCVLTGLSLLLIVRKYIK